MLPTMLLSDLDPVDIDLILILEQFGITRLVG